MNGWERSMRAIHREATDRPPVHPLVMTLAARLIGASYQSCVSDYRVLVDAQVRAAEDYGLDCVTVCSDPCREAADLGARVIWFPDQPPTPDPNSPLIADKADLAKLRAPDISSGGRMHDRVNAVDLLRERVGGELAIVGWVEGPMAQAADIRGINTVMLDLVDDPQFVIDLFEFVTPLEIEFAKAQIEAGADIIGIGDAAASLIGPRFYSEYVLPYEKRMVDAIHAMGAPVRLHICGNIDALLGEIAGVGVDMIDIDFLTDLSLARRLLGPDIAMMANIDPVRCILQGTPETIRAALAECHRIVGRHFVVGAGCEIPPDTSAENVRTMLEYSLSAQCRE